jgi:hypothetical protein
MKKHFTILIFFTFVALVSAGQTFQVGHKQKTFIDALRANRNITTEIYYPSNTAGENVAISSGIFPVIVFGHGFVMTWSAYEVEWNAIVPNGYIMIFPTTETSISPSHEDFGKDIAFLVESMKAEGFNSTSFFYGAVASTSAVMGHSMGGGSAFLAVQHDSSITALATFAAAVTTPSSITAAKNITIPSIVFSGVNDCVAPPAQHQIPMYDSLISVCKTLVNITGASHCQFANVNTSCYFGEGTCSPQATISSSAQQTITFDLLLPWLNFYLKNNCTDAALFQNLISAGTGITSQQNCTLNCTPTGIENRVGVANISIYPNPFNYFTTIKTNADFKYATFTIYNFLGQQIRCFSGHEFVLNREDLPNGIYFIRLSHDNKIIATDKLIIIN